MLKIYRHEGSGHHIGSCIAVVADSQRDAEEHIQRLLIQEGLPDEGLSISELTIADGAEIVVINGDY